VVEFLRSPYSPHLAAKPGKKKIALRGVTAHLPGTATRRRSSTEARSRSRSATRKSSSQCRLACLSGSTARWRTRCLLVTRVS
jgi:hypothetical protein